VRLLDGWHRLLPPGMGADAWAGCSYLAQAYLRHERAPGTAAGIYTLNAGITDRAEPREVLRAAVAWWSGVQPRALLLSTRQVDAFRAGGTPADEAEVRGEAGALLGLLALELEPGAEARWTVAADTGLDQAAAAELVAFAGSPGAGDELDEAIAADRVALRARLAACDALGASGDRHGDDAHRSATLYNLMRGGMPASDLGVDRDGFLAWLGRRNPVVAARHRTAIAAWPARLDLPGLVQAAGECGDPQLERLAGSYLPLSFSRRHGDPSRPWNRFAIRLVDGRGAPVSAWQGNWRDIFQNWEALALSFPALLPAMIATFLDASTADGYNPYRVTSEGIDWEVPEPGPWSHFGYWGDHQIVYLTRLLELAEAHHPGWLGARLARRCHASAAVPYRIRGLEALLADPAHSVDFDHQAQAAVEERRVALGADGRLVPGPDGQPRLFSLAEKLLVPVLVKLANLVPGAGIWLNTQRPEWNDANNALVGWGCSLVTVHQLHRHLALLARLFAAPGSWPVSAATAGLLSALAAALPECQEAAGDDRRRRAAIGLLGRAGEAHRGRIYAGDHGAEVLLGAAAAQGLLAAATAALDATLACGRRADGLAHSYTVLRLEGDTAAVGHLGLMLEGQVAALAGGTLAPASALALARCLRASALWDPARATYLLQPDAAITPFLARNRLPPAAAGLGLVAQLTAAGDRRLVVRDGASLRFAADLANARELAERLDRLAAEPTLAALAAHDRAALLAAWEDTFRHRSYLGRSTTMFAFEGLGCVYWHMVSKLRLALEECAAGAGDPALSAELGACADGVAAGLGPARGTAFGAFPWDPYSHTPAGRGAQQPGMTGQVKEEILARRHRLGVVVEDGGLAFATARLRAGDRLTEPGTLAWVDLDGRERRRAVPAGGLAFTVCQVPVVYRPGAQPALVVECRDGTRREFPGHRLPRPESQALFHRSGEIAAIDVVI
jgi:hypothetical protein